MPRDPKEGRAARAHCSPRNDGPSRSVGGLTAVPIEIARGARERGVPYLGLWQGEAERIIARSGGWDDPTF